MNLTDYIGNPASPGPGGVSEQVFGTSPGNPLLYVDTGIRGQPNPAAGARPGARLIINAGGGRWEAIVDHTEQLDGERIRVWLAWITEVC